MKTFISILRGINVSGYKKILMSDLKDMYEDLKFKNVKTYIQSGNVVFDTDEKSSNQDLAEKIEHAIFEKYNFHVPVLVRTAEEMQNTISVNPFLKADNMNIEKLHVTFLAEKPVQANLDNIKNIDYPPDQFIIIDKDIFLHCPDKYGETKLSNKFFESKLKVSATTRNWKTIQKLLDISTKK